MGDFFSNFVFLRPVIVLHYMAFFLLPLVVLAFFQLWTNRPYKRGKVASDAGSLNQPDKTTFSYPKAKIILGLLYFLVGMGLIVVSKDFPPLMPYLNWNFDALRLNVAFEIVLTVITLVGALLFGFIFLQSYKKASWQLKPTHLKLLDLVTLFLVLLQLFYVQFGDEYLLALIPFSLITVGSYLKDWLERFQRVFAVGCLLLLLLSATWTRGLLSAEETYWRASESVRLSGVSPDLVFSRWTWICYYSFDEYLKTRDNTRDIDFGDIFTKWLPERRKQTQYLITEETNPPPGENWQLMQQFNYQNIIFQNKTIRVIKVTTK